MKHTPENVLKVIKSMRENVAALAEDCSRTDDKSGTAHFYHEYIVLDQVIALFEHDRFFHQIAKIHGLEESEGKEVNE